MAPMRVLLPFLLALLVAGSGWFEFCQPLTAAALVRQARDKFDPRPVRRVLILGNSRTYYHDMPDMIRAMADSAGDPKLYDIAVEAQGGASFESLWNDPRARSLLGERWDDAIFQSESRAQASEDFARSFQDYGARLIGATHLNSGTPRLIVNWGYGPQLWDDGDPDGRGRQAYDAAIRSGTAALGRRTGATLVDIGQLWDEIAVDHPDIRLTEDGNHPTLAGSYLFALMLYGDLSRRDVGLVTYRPDGIDLATATTLREAVRRYRAFSS